MILAKPKSMQALGSAITYTRRYSVQALLGLATEDDGSAASGQTIVPHTTRETRLVHEAMDPVDLVPDPPTNGAAPPRVTVPTDAGRPCEGQEISALRPPQLALLVDKVERLAKAQGGRWATLLAVLRTEREGRLARGQRPKGTPATAEASAVDADVPDFPPPAAVHTIGEG